MCVDEVEKGLFSIRTKYKFLKVYLRLERKKCVCVCVEREEEELWPLNMRLSRLCPVSAWKASFFFLSVDPTLLTTYLWAHCSKGRNINKDMSQMYLAIIDPLGSV